MRLNCSYCVALGDVRVRNKDVGVQYGEDKGGEGGSLHFFTPYIKKFKGKS